MKLYSENKEYKLYNGSMLDMLEVIEPNSIDSIITDPPYELNFMNKGWDNSGIAFQKETWQKCFEVLKPGGYLLAFGGSRTFHRIACAIEDAGFEIRDTIMWLYGSGFPKSMDISKQIDKKGGNNYSKQFAKDLKEARESRNLTMKYCDDKYCNGSTNWSWYEGRKDGCRVPDYQTYLEIIKEFPELEKYRELIKEAEREVIGNITRTKGIAIPACGETIDRSEYNYNITTATTDLAKKWQGWGTALKSAYEPIIVARKPVENSVVDNVIEYGVGGINIDECRVGNETHKVNINDFSNQHGNKFGNGEPIAKLGEKEITGRFPANVILTYDETDFEEVCGGMPDTKSNGSDYDFTFGNQENSTHLYTNIKSGNHFDDEGSAARYFYCAKASKFDRDEGLEEFLEQEVRVLNATNPENEEKDDVSSRFITTKKNVHPTVKPCELMRYLVRLVSPKGATILDCFNGSGSTGKAVMLENKKRNANYKYIGIELTDEYLPISKARIEYVINNDFDFWKDENNRTQHEKVNKDIVQTTLFDFLGGRA